MNEKSDNTCLSRSPQSDLQCQLKLGHDDCHEAHVGYYVTACWAHTLEEIEMITPYSHENKALVKTLTELIAKYEESREECTCSDDEDGGCWYRLTDKEQLEEKLDFLIGCLSDMKPARRPVNGKPIGNVASGGLPKIPANGQLLPGCSGDQHEITGGCNNC